MTSALLVAAAVGTLTVSSIGYDRDDSTRFLQQALDSGASRVVLDRQAGPWVTGPLVGRSDQEIVFEPGVELEAKRGAFQAKGDALLSFRGRRNVRIVGNGGVLRMHREDYVKRPYAPSEYRHGLVFLDCEGVSVSDLTIASTGGDAVYLGARPDGCCRDVVLDGLVTTNNHRQGVSVISAERLTIRNCRFLDTCGVPPMAAVDFEPNHPGQRLVDCLVTNCTSRGNRGYAWDVVVPNLCSTSRPVSIRIVDCTSSGDGGGVRIFNENRAFDEVCGEVAFVRCSFADWGHTLFRIQQNPDLPLRPVFRGTVPNRDWRQFVDSPVLRGRQSATVTSADRWTADSLSPVDGAPGKMAALSTFFGRFHIRYAVWADAPRRLRFRGRQGVVVRAAGAAQTPIVVRNAEGTVVTEIAPPGFEEADFGFDAPAAGLYTLDVSPERQVFALTASDAPVAVDLRLSQQAFFKSTGDLWFAVPPGCEAFSLAVAGSGNEGVRADLTDPSGRVCWSEPSALRVYRYVPESCKAGVWRLSIRKPKQGVLEDFKLDLVGVPGLLALNPQKMLTSRAGFLL